MVRRMENNLYRIERMAFDNLPTVDVAGMLTTEQGLSFIKLHPVKLIAKPKSENCTVEKTMQCWAESYFKGAGDFMRYLVEYSKTVSSIYVDEMEDILVKFCEQFGEVKKIDGGN